jgi:Na/Pi-cotransporter
MIEWIRVLGGFGLYLFALRFLTRLLRRSLNRNLRQALLHMLSHPVRCVIAGICITLLVQASSITMLTVMGLVGAGVVSVEQAFFVALGSGLGGSVKGWYGGLAIYPLGPILVGCASLGLVLLKRERFRVSCEAIGALGFAFWGLHELSEGILPASQSPQFQQVLHQLAGTGLAEQSLGVIAGCVLAALVQSSTTVAMLAVSLVQEGRLALPECAGMILGANVGTSIVLLFASLEYSRDVRRLAFSHALAKFLSLGLTLLFLPQFLTMVDVLVELASTHKAPAFQLAAVHTTFNVLVLLTWGLLPYPVLSLASRVIPDRGEILDSVALPAAVRKLFSRSPERCVEEADNQLRQLSLQTKNLLDDNLRALCLGRWKTAGGSTENQEAHFEELKEAILDLLIRGMRANPHPELQVRLQAHLRRLLLTEKVYTEAFRLRDLLREGLAGERIRFAPEQLAAHKDYADALRALWLNHLTSAQPDLDLLDRQLPESIARAAALFLNDHGQHLETSAWMFSVYSRLRGLAYLVREIVQDPHGDAFSLQPSGAGGESSGSGADPATS